MGRPIVTLTTDWGDQDFFVGMAKGLLYRLIDGVQVVDVAHHVKPYSVLDAIFVVRNGCMGFPPGTVHLIDVGTDQPFVVVKCRQQYFVCSDNGLPAMVFGDEVEGTAEIAVKPTGVYNFAVYSLFAQVAARLLSGEPLSAIGSQCELRKETMMPGYIAVDGQYRVYVRYVDHYGNAYLGMSYSEFNDLRQGRPFVMTVRDQEVTEVMQSYHQQHRSNDRRHKLRLTVSATGMLELAVKESSLQQLLGLQVNGSVMLRFKDV